MIKLTFCCCLRQGLHDVTLAGLELIEVSLPLLLSAGTKGIDHHTLHKTNVLKTLLSCFSK